MSARRNVDGTGAIASVANTMAIMNLIMSNILKNREYRAPQKGFAIKTEIANQAQGEAWIEWARRNDPVPPLPKIAIVRTKPSFAALSAFTHNIVSSVLP